MLGKLEFYKKQATGNDYICIKDVDYFSTDQLSQLAQKLCQRRFGIGADGLLIAYPSQTASIGMRIFNADGSEPEMCGNGLRCFAKFAYEQKLVKDTKMTVQTKLSTKKADILIDAKTGQISNIKTSLGKPDFTLSNIAPALISNSWLDKPLKFGIFEFNVSLISLDNPHAVIFLEDISTLDIEKIGPLIENDSKFPNRINIEFVKVKDSSHIEQRTWERGVGETLSCGTGAAAAGIAAVLTKNCQSKLNIKLLGGSLEFDWPDQDSEVFIYGEAVDVFKGSVELPF